MAEIEGEARRARTGQRAERDAGVEHADDAADIASAEIIHDERGQDRDEAAVEYSIGEGESGEPPEIDGQRPDDQGERHTGEHDDQRALAAQPVGEAAKEEAARRTADADQSEEHDRTGLRDAVIERVRYEVYERDEQPERANQTCRVEAQESMGYYSFAHGGAARTRQRNARLQKIAIRCKATVARIVLDQQSRPHADNGGEASKNEIGLAPSQRGDEQRCERRHNQRADANAADRQARGEPAALDEPALHRAQHRNIGTADAKSDAEPIGRVDFR